jgi:hypothetical protein
MKRSVLVMLAALLALLLAACAPAGTPAPTQQSSSAATKPATSVPPTNAPQPTVPVAPRATPDIQKVINVQPDDWKRGPDSAGVKIIEWSDFQ